MPATIKITLSGPVKQAVGVNSAKAKLSSKATGAEATNHFEYLCAAAMAVDDTELEYSFSKPSTGTPKDGTYQVSEFSGIGDNVFNLPSTNPTFTYVTAYTLAENQTTPQEIKKDSTTTFKIKFNEDLVTPPSIYLTNNATSTIPCTVSGKEATCTPTGLTDGTEYTIYYNLACDTTATHTTTGVKIKYSETVMVKLSKLSLVLIGLFLL